ncbi:hypothetical protein LOC54_10430 [Acetobacter sp. AN02]|uniref:hypothetical protein n=1 Tax=Acetobacter sp. AN02 TaxID=2894186 RepID=UPI0024340EEF|nr:hypothetical protein [Acetobacter sp. AN02]MDG6095512.1 hypothetical protein [Acetobacter sp. AN02]
MFQSGHKTRACGILLAIMTLPGCVSTADQVANKEDHLAAAGFVFRPASTKERQIMLSRLPANRFTRKIRNDQVWYIYADPTVCGCLYVGDQAAWAKYQQYRQARAIADEQQSSAEDQMMAAQDYQDSSWNWGAWGPGGPWGGPMGGWGPGW